MSERGDGLTLVTFASALFFPLWAVVGYSHLEHWQSGPIANGWTEIVKPWGCLIWAGVLLFILSGWVVYSHKVTRGFFGSLIYIAIGLFCVVISALPGAFWLAQIGNIDLTEMVRSLMLVACAFAVPCLIGGGMAKFVSAKFGHLFVLGTGSVALFWIRVYV
ncbi:MAG: hypothetical protein VYA30_04235 [Myxococcota bacterium]|nr:hypothetical protein [Myxococcota bacterium]